MIRFSGCKRGEACTIVLRGNVNNSSSIPHWIGPTKHLLNEAQRSLHDALSVLSQVPIRSCPPFVIYSQVVATEKRTVLGAGCSEMIMALAVEKLAKATPGKESIAIESFSRALRRIPTIIADNGGPLSIYRVVIVNVDLFSPVLPLYGSFRSLLCRTFDSVSTYPSLTCLLCYLFYIDPTSTSSYPFPFFCPLSHLPIRLRQYRLDFRSPGCPLQWRNNNGIEYDQWHHR